MILFLSTLSHVPQQGYQAALDRLASFAKSARTLTVDITLTSPAVKGPGSAKFVFVRPKSMSFDVKWDGKEYRAVGAKHGLIETESSTRVYDLSPYEELDAPFSRISGAPRGFFPSLLFAGKFDEYSVDQFSYAGTEQVGGVKTDHVHASGQHNKVDVYLAPDGRPVRFVILHGGGLKVQADFSNYVINKPVAPSAFVYDPPAGYLEYSLFTGGRPLGVAETFPTKGWQGPNQSLDDGSGGKPLLIALVAPDSEPAAKSAGALGKLESSGAVSVVVISTASNGSIPSNLRQFPAYRDPGSAVLERLHLPGTPCFYLLDKNAKVLKVWYGFDSGAATAFERDVKAAANEAGR